MHQELQTELTTLYAQLNAQLAVMNEEAHQLGINELRHMRLSDGSWAITPILAAKAEVLSALVTLAAPRS